MNKLKLLHTLICATAVTVAFIAIATISAELSPAFKDWLKATFTHHWIGKGVLAILLFIITSIIGYQINLKLDLNTITQRMMLLVYVSIASALVIALFFGYEAFFTHG